MHWKGNCLCNGRNRSNTVNKFCKERSQRSQWPFCVFTKQNSKFNTMLTVKHWHDDDIINSHVTSINYSKLKGIVPNLQLARSRPTMQKTYICIKLWLTISLFYKRKLFGFLIYSGGYRNKLETLRWVKSEKPRMVDAVKPCDLVLSKKWNS